jgi:ABC transporter DrrB family efflux protein
MRGFAFIAKKELIHIRRDPVTIIMALVFPLMQLFLYGYAIDFEVRHLPMVVADFDHSRESRDYTISLRNTTFVRIARYVPTVEDALDAMRSGEARVAVIIPPDFARATNPQVKVLVDGSDSTVATRVIQAFRRPPPSLSAGAVDARVRVLYNAEMRTTNFMIPGLIGLLLQILTVSLTSFSLVREREQGTLDQLMVTPVGRLGLMVGKLVPYGVLAFIELFAVVGVGWLVFGVPLAGNIFVLALLSIPFVLAALALGLLVSTIVQNQAQALQFTMLLTMPAVILSGFIFPRETMPGALYALSWGIPVTHFLQILRGVVIRGAGFWDMWVPFVSLTAMAAVLILLAASRFRKSIA